MNPVISKIENEISRVIASAGNDRLLVTVSGGADSVAMLVALNRLKADVVAAHCNFHLRGEESDRDQHFVENLCARLGVENKIIHFDVEAYRKANGGSIEMACRELRYEWFYKLKDDLKCGRILTAHHADDNIETMLLNMMRGCGLEGAKGMVADNGIIMRPMLKLHRTEIETYLRTLGQDWIVDSTNLDAEPDRNFIRLEVLPLLEKRFPGVAQRLSRTQQNLQEAFNIYDSWRNETIPEGKTLISIADILSSPSPSTMLHEWLGNRFSSSQELEILREIRRPQSHTRQWSCRENDSYVLLNKNFLQKITAESPAIIIEEKTLAMSPGLMYFIKHNTYQWHAYFPHPLSHYTIRNVREGDRLKIGNRKHKKIFDLLQENSVPVPYRKGYPVLVSPDTDTPLWIPGIRRAETEYVNAESPECYIFKAIPQIDK